MSPATTHSVVSGHIINTTPNLEIQDIELNAATLISTTTQKLIPFKSIHRIPSYLTLTSRQVTRQLLGGIEEGTDKAEKMFCLERPDATLNQNDVTIMCHACVHKIT